MSQTMLFRPGKMLRVWDRFDVDFIAVPAADVSSYLSRGWYAKPGEWEAGGERADEPKRRGRKPKDAAE